MKIKDLKQPYKEMALIEQEAQGNPINEDEYLKASFFWNESFCKHDFWEDAYWGRTPEITPEIKAKFPSVFKDDKEASKRYFIVSYSGKINSNIFVGFTDFSTDGCFLNFRTTIEQIKERQGINECVITNIIELNEQDFNDWNS
jgi:hypothetical protein